MSSVERAAARKSCSTRAIVAGFCPPSVSVVTVIMRAMEFADVLRRRKMVRSYTDEPVEREAVERIVKAGLRAPSGGFSQGARFVVGTDEGLRRRIAELGQ